MKKLILLFLVLLLGAASFSAFSAKPKTKTETVTYVVSMHCQNCVDKLTDHLSFIKGVKDCRISLKNKTVTIQYDPSKVQENTFVETMQKMGYTVTKQNPQKSS